MNDYSSFSSRWTISLATEHDKPGIKALFAEVFQQTMSEALWQWKYGQGRGAAVVAKRGTDLIAHYGGVKRDVSFQGQRQDSVQCVDTMVKSTERGTLARKGPYFLVAQEFLERYVGYNRPYEFGYGFPNKRVMRLGERVGIQASIGSVVEPVWSPLSISKYRDHDFDSNNYQHRHIVDALNETMLMALSGSIVGVRDSNYIQYRYVDNPLHSYYLKLVHDVTTDTVLGLVVFRVADSRLSLLDLVGPPENFPELIEQVRWWCYQLAAYEMSAWITQAHLSVLGNTWGRLDDPEVRIPTSVCTDGPSPESLYDKWWLTCGDTDFK